MTYISRKTRLLLPRWLDECQPGHLYHLHRKRSEGRLKRFTSCDDLRAWVNDNYLNYQHLLELMTGGESRPFVGTVGRFIPVKNLLDILCGNATQGFFEECTFGFAEQDSEDKPVKKSPGRCLDESNITPDEILNFMSTAMETLENINYILHNDSICEGKNQNNEEHWSDTSGRAEKFSEERVTCFSSLSSEEFEQEYNNTIRKISCLEQKLKTIEEKKKELMCRMERSPTTLNKSKSDMAVTELYSRDEHSHPQRLQKKMEKLILDEKGRVLNEMCETVNYLNDLGKNRSLKERSSSSGNNNFKTSSGCPCSCPRIENEGNASEQTILEIRRGITKTISGAAISRTDCPISTTAESEMNYQKYAHKPFHGEDIDMLTSLDNLPGSESQHTYNITNINEPIPDRKFKSDTTMTEVEQALRSYKQRLTDLEGLAIEIGTVKKNAELACYFKRRWLRSTARRRTHNAAEREMRNELGQLNAENLNLKKTMQTLSAISERKQMDLRKLKRELEQYQLSYEKQIECINRLETKVCEQRKEIKDLKGHVAELRCMSKKMKDCRRSLSRSRSYGPESKMSDGQRECTGPGENVQYVPCCVCGRDNSCGQNRPKSEYGRRFDVHNESFPCKQSCRRPHGHE